MVYMIDAGGWNFYDENGIEWVCTDNWYSQKRVSFLKAESMSLVMERLIIAIGSPTALSTCHADSSSWILLATSSRLYTWKHPSGGVAHVRKHTGNKNKGFKYKNCQGHLGVLHQHQHQHQHQWAALSCIDHVVVIWCKICHTGLGLS